MLFGVTLITFIIFNVAGGDPAFHLAGKNPTTEQIESIRQELGLNKSLLLQYLDFVKQTITLDWGESWLTHKNINSMILEGVGPSLSLTLPAFLLSFLISIFIALFSAAKKSTKNYFNQSLNFICLALMSISFLVYIICFQYLFAFHFRWFALNGWDPSWTGRWEFLILPWIIAIVVSIGPNILIFRSAFFDEVVQDYVRTAQAKGLNRVTLFGRHILKNAMIPVTTIVVMQIPFLITGNLLLETFFGIPGIGGLLIQSIQNADFPTIKALTVMGSILYLFFNLLADLLYTFFDPRIDLK